MEKRDILKNGQNGIDASDISAIMGINKNKNAHDVYFEKIDYINRTSRYGGILEKPSEANYWKLTFDEMLAQEFSFRSSKKVRKGKKQLIDDEYEFMVGNINRKVVGENSILLCKCENVFLPIEWNEEEVPANYMLEAQHSMRVSKAEKCYIGATCF